MSKWKIRFTVDENIEVEADNEDGAAILAKEEFDSWGLVYADFPQLIKEEKDVEHSL